MTVAWLTLDRFDVSLGRLLTFVELALREADPQLAETVSGALTKGVAHARAAELLAAGLTQPVVLVVDEVEHIAETAPAMALFQSLVDAAAGQLRLTLISRRQVELISASDLASGTPVTHLTESDLAFTVDEARQALSASSRDDVDADEAVSATGGWVTGVLFGAWRSVQHVHGTGGESDPLDTYLSQQILSSVDVETKQFLVETSLLDPVTPEAAARLGYPDFARYFEGLDLNRLPLEFLDDMSFRWHPRFRQYLQSELRQAQQSRQEAIHTVHAELLRQNGDLEDAVHAFLDAGAIHEARQTAELVAMTVARRLDFDVLERWLAAFGPEAVLASFNLTAAELLLALDREEYGRGVECADRLLRMISPEGAGLDARLVGPMAWCYFVVGRITDAEAVIDRATPSAESEVIKFAIGVELVDNPIHYRDRPADTGSELEGLLSRVDLAHGRFEQLAASYRPAESTASTLSRAGALVGLGDLEGAGSIFASVPAAGWTRTRLWAEYMAECGKPEEAWAALIDGREHLVKSGAGLFRMFAWLTEAMLALRFGQDTALATAALRAAEREPTALRRVRVLEQLALWRGLIGLLDGNDETAVHHLREAVGLMTYWDRRLFLPRAGVYLAEAEWRAGDEGAAERAANLALKASQFTGSRHGLLEALKDFPDVLSRQVDAALDPDSPWHELGRSLLDRRDSDGESAPVAVHVVEFGKPGVRVEGRLHQLPLLKCAEVLSYLSVQKGPVEKDDLVADLFDSKNTRAAQSYLRMALNKLRAVPGLSDSLHIEATTIAWTGGRLSSDVLEVSKAHARLKLRTGKARYVDAMETLKSLPTGDFFPGARSAWAGGRREEWERLRIAVTQTAAEAAFEVSDYLTSHRLASDVLASDPFLERAWRLKMRSVAALGDGDQVIAIYRACARTLAEVPTTPADSTRRLLEQLRL